MRQPSSAGALLLGAILLLVPLAAAAPAHGALTVTGTAALPGASTLTAPSGQLAWAAPSGAPALLLENSGATVRLYGHEATSQPTPIGNVATSTSEKPGDAQDHGPATLRLEPGRGPQSLILRSAGPVEATLTDATLQGIAAAYLGSAKPRDVGGAGPCPAEDPCFDAWGVHALAARDMRATLAGDVTLLVHGPTLLLGDSRIETGAYESTTGTLTTTHDVYALVTLRGAHGTLAAQGATWYAAAPTLTTGALVADTAGGVVDVGARSYHAASERLDVAGALTLAPAPVAPGTSWGKLADGDAGHSVAAPAFGVQLSGDVQRVNLRAAPLFVDAPLPATGLAAALVALALAGAYFWPHLSFAGASLYTRLRQPELLDNEVRNAIYEIVRGNPGISARAVHRASTQSWGTVVYHLRQLERHHLVVSRSVGRTRNYYENHGKYKGMEVQLACLQSPRARTLARLVLDRPGIVQEDLSAGSGFPQPTTSYYVRKLKAAGLVEERREGRYARYHPVGEVARFLEMAEANAAPTVGQMADAAVDA